MSALLCQYFVSVFSNQDLAFPLGRRQSVVCADGPSVGFVDKDFVASHVNHRFDGERHARHYQHARTTFAEVFHIRFFVELDAAAMSGLGYEVTGSELWVGIMPAWIAGLATCLLIAAFLGKKEAKRIAAGIPAQEVTGLTEAKATNTSNELARSGWRWYFNVALILVILYILVTNRLSPAVTFMIGYCVLLIVNYPSVDLQHKIINSHAQAAFLMVSIVFAAGAFTGVVKNSGMLASMTDALVSIIPTSMGTFIAPIVGLFSVPLSLLFDPDSYYYGVMPVIANAVSAMGGNALAVAKASIMGQMTLGFPLSPLTGATFLLLGLSGQDLGDHQKHTLPYAWVASAIMVAVGCVACGLLF